MIYYMTSLVCLVFALYLNHMSHQTMFQQVIWGRGCRRNYNIILCHKNKLLFSHCIHTDNFFFLHCIIMTECVFQLFLSLIYHLLHIRKFWILILSGWNQQPGNDRLFPFHHLLKTHSNQEQDNEIYHPPLPESIEKLVERIINSVTVWRLSD